MKEIKLSQGKVALVDDDDFNYVNQFNWFIQKSSHTYYARTTKQKDGKITRFLMHRLIIKAPNGSLVDHIDKNGLNNQKSNLRLVNDNQNMWNRISTGKSIYKGVSFYFDNKGKRYIRASIRINGKQEYLGTFRSEEEAARKYDEVALKYRGEYSSINFNIKNHD